MDQRFDSSRDIFDRYERCCRCLHQMKLRLTLVWLFLTTLAWGQTTSVTLQVTDADGQSWGNGTWSVVLTTPPGNPVPPLFKIFGTNTTVPNQQQGGILSLTGLASLTVTPNASIAPA